MFDEDNPVCVGCKAELKKPGGLLFGPPIARDMVNKHHLCTMCYGVVFRFVLDMSNRSRSKTKEGINW